MLISIYSVENKKYQKNDKKQIKKKKIEREKDYFSVFFSPFFFLQT